MLIALGSNDPRVAERAAELYHGGFGATIVFSGHQGRGTLELYGKSEAEHFREIAVARGVPPDRIIVETQSTNTGENIRFTRALLEAGGAVPRSALIVQKPYMERRARATVRRWWPELEAGFTSPVISYAEYELPWLPKEKLITMMVGDLHRILVYPQLGFQAEEHVPAEVVEALHKLVKLGFGGHLVPGYQLTI
jgi:uncharacterized SAM-binding protein YcdF (DUF218 family)